VTRSQRGAGVIIQNGPVANQPAFEMAPLNLESSNQLFETLEEWKDYLER
jgi:hypothetical protein